MSVQREIPKDMQRLIDELIDYTIPEAGLLQLDQSLLQQPDLLEYFLDYCQLHIDLAIDFRADRALESFRQRQQCVGGIVAAAPASAGTVVAPPAITTEESPFGTATGADITGGSSLFGLSKFFALGVTLCLLMLVAAAGLWQWRMASEAEDRAPLNLASVGDGDTPHVTSVQIESGSTKLALAGIGSVVVEGPADFELLGPMRARLNKGRIKMHVTETSGHGFVVETPDGDVEDLGTEFGIDVVDQLSTGLVVFQGMVDLRTSTLQSAQRLFGGDGVRISKGGQLDRITSIVTGNTPTFQWRADADGRDPSAIITRVSDNIRTGEVRKFYEIVPHGMCEDAKAYVDRQEHEWNGVTVRGMPSYLIGADYVKPFNNDKMRQDVELEVTLSAPARLFVLFDDRVPPPKWLKERGFSLTRDHIGLDMGESFDDRGRPITNMPKGNGPGVSIDQTFSIWEKKVPKAGKITLGATAGISRSTAMYGVAAIPLEGSHEQHGKQD